MNAVEEDLSLREHDLEDLMEAWRKSIEELKFVWSPENAAKAQETFDAVIEYIHAGETPKVEGDPNDRLLTVTSIVCPKCHTTYTRDALERLSGKCLVCGRKVAAL